jgi:sugar-phosphatase
MMFFFGTAPTWQGAKRGERKCSSALFPSRTPACLQKKERGSLKQFMCEAILFDLDGVLVNSTVCIERHWNLWAQRHGLDIQKILAVAHGRRSIDTIRLIAPYLPAESEAQLLEQGEAQDTEGLVTYPGAARLLAALDAQRWAVVTSGSQALATARLLAAGLPLPKVLLTAEDVTSGKPDPEGYLKAAQQLGEPPEHCVVIEDAPAGIQAARRAQMPVIAVASTHPPAQLQDADVWIPSLEALSISLASASGPDHPSSLTLHVTDEHAHGERSFQWTKKEISE